MFCYQDKVNAGVPQVCTPEIWDQLIDSPEVKSICDQIAALAPNTPDYNDRKQALKRRLPIIIPHAASFRNGKRVSADAIPSGLAMLDVDHINQPKDWFDRCQVDLRIKTAYAERPSYGLKDFFAEHGIVLVAITASGHGLRVIGKRRFRTGASQPSGMESIEEAQMRMAEVLGIKEYDAVTKDLARASYVVPREYILWINEEGLFSEQDRDDLLQHVSFLPALPPHEDKKDTSYEDALSYRGITYNDIIDQLLIATGNGDGAVQGERNTVYFSLAAYMRYICDFNASLLFQILPDFGPPLSVVRAKAKYRWCSNRLSLSAKKSIIWTSNRRWRNLRHYLCPNCRVCSNWYVAVCPKTTVLR